MPIIIPPGDIPAGDSVVMLKEDLVIARFSAEANLHHMIMQTLMPIAAAVMDIMKARPPPSLHNTTPYVAIYTYDDTPGGWPWPSPVVQRGGTRKIVNLDAVLARAY